MVTDETVVHSKAISNREVGAGQTVDDGRSRVVSHRFRITVTLSTMDPLHDQHLMRHGRKTQGQ
jgi:hypothetical protein